MKKTFIGLLMASMLLLSGCAVAAEPARIIALKGPTGIGMAQMITEQNPDLRFTQAASPDEVVSAIASGSCDIAAVPTNLAATLYNKTGGKVQLLALNTLGVLHVLEKGESIRQVSDLEGKTLYLTGQGAMPEYVIRYIMAQFDLNLTLEFKAEHSELATLAASGMADLVMLPEPFVTSLLTQDKGFRLALDVTELFSQAAEKAGNPGTVLSMGCLIARKDFVDKNPALVRDFLKANEASIAFAVANPQEAALLVEKAEIMPKAAVAQRAIPNCNLVFVAGEELRAQVEPMFQMLFDANPASVGGAMPGDDFYYVYQP